MKIRNILYISAIMLLAGCSKDADISNSTTLSGNGEKTPLLINATLDTGKGQTRAVGETFAYGDELKVYFRHTIDNGAGGYNFATVGLAPSLVRIGVTSTSTSPTLSPIYWDDFSDNTDATKDLRTSGHALQSYYAYCYNGGSPTTDLTAGTGILGWTVQPDQREAEAFQHSDLLWSPEQTPVSYDHNNNYTNTFPVPFTHAMCEITVVLEANSSAGFSGNPLASTKLKLHNMYTQTTLTAPSSGWGSVTGPADIYMYGGTTTTGLIRTYTAIVAPGTKLKEGEKLLDVTGAGDNDYEVYITGIMLDADHWASGHEAGQHGNLDGDGKDCVITQPGVNYHLALRIDKSAVQVSASLAPWTDVTATGTGAIQFTNNEVNVGGTNNFASSSAFSLFWRKASTSDPYSCVTTSTYNGSNWTNTPPLYWPNKNESYYFRALAKVNSGNVTAATPTLTTEAWNTTSIALSNGGYILWGTTAAHVGEKGSYALGAAIPPRTGGVPLDFRVVNKCKVSFTLATAGDYDAVKDPATYAEMLLSEATISINNIYTEGTINLEDGTVTGDESSKTTLGGSTNSIAEQEVLAQRISNDAVVTIAFKKDATEYSTFKIRLKDCVSGGSTPITVWEGGHTYNYTIRVEKEAVKFSAAVKSWATVSGSGTATMVDENT